MDFPPPPEGSTPYMPQPQNAAIPPPPEGSEPIAAQAPIPPSQPPQTVAFPAPPAESTEINPFPPPPADSVPTNDPGFFGAVGNSFMKGLQSRAAADAGFAKLSAGIGLEQQFQDSLIHPEVKDEIDNLLGQKITEGWSSPKWWAAQIAHGTGGMVPGLGAAGAGALVGGPIGAVAGFGIEGATGTLVPAYIAARAGGLSPEDAMKRALIDTGISAATATAMGIAPEFSIYGKVANPAVTDQVAEMLKRPALEAITQLGLVQPSLGTAGAAATTLSHGEVPKLEDLSTDFATGVGMGIVPVGAHATIRGFNALKPPPESLPIAPPERVVQSFENQQPRTAVPGEEISPPSPEGFVEHETSPEAKIFYSPVLRAAQDRLPASASADQVLATLRNTPGVKEEEIADLRLPQYLADHQGKVNKDDLVAHIESQAVQLTQLSETQFGESYATKLARQIAEKENGLGSWDIIGGGGQAHYLQDARNQVMRGYVSVLHDLEEKYKTVDQGRWPLEARELLQEERRKTQELLNGNPVQYGSPVNVLAGPHSNYREFVLSVPERGRRIVEDNPNYDPNFPSIYRGGGENEPFRERLDNSLNITDPRHFSPIINQVAHFRVTDRIDRDGRKLLHVEEVQSDIHQEGRKQGYLKPGEKGAENLDDIEARMDAIRREGDRLGWTDERRNRYQDIRVEFQTALAQRGKLPDLPFKTSWPELTVKRILRLAADEGYDGVSWANGDQVGLRLSSREQLKGAREFYDKILPRLFKRWADKLGADTGTTRIGDNFPVGSHLERLPPHVQAGRRAKLDELGLTGAFNKQNQFLLVNPAFSDRARMGFPLYETGPRSVRINDVLTVGLPKELEKPALKVGQIVRQFSRDMGITRNVRTVIEPSARKERGYVDVDAQGRYVIHINTNRLRTAEDLYATAAHEFGHIVQHNKFEGAPDHLKVAVFADFEAKKQKYLDLVRSGGTVGDLRSIRDNAISQETGARNLRLADGTTQDQIPLSDLTRSSSEYMRSFQEYFAEQVAKWATTSDLALSKVDKFFKALGKQIRKIISVFKGRNIGDAEAVPELQKWLDSLLAQDAGWYSNLKDTLNLRTRQENQNAVDRDGTPEVNTTPQTPTTGGGRDILNNLPNRGGPGGPSMAAHADRMNKFYEWMTSLPQIAAMNRHIQGLTIYKEIVSLMNLEKNNIMGAAHDTLRAWKGIKDPQQLFALNKFIEDYANGFFKLPHTQDGLVRRPTREEFLALAQKHKLSAQSLAVFDRLVKDFDGFLEQYRTLLLADARRIKDPRAQAQAIADANGRVDKLLSRPFFPLTRFGKYTITVYDTAGNIRHFEQTNSLRRQRMISDALEKSPDLLPGDRVRTGEIAKDSAPLLGMPPGLLDALENKLNLSSTQRAMLDQLRFDYAPSQSFRHQFRSVDVTPGYSTDFQRSYAHFFFHGANHITRVKWVDALRDQIREVKRDSILLNNANKRDQIANYMTQHLDMLVDPKPDFAALRGLMFHWFLGFNPASATLNLSQTPIMTYPHLASKFGDIKSLSALARAGTELNNFYKKGTLQELGKSTGGVNAPAKARARAEAIKEGVISETQAHTLAAISEDRNLLRAFGSKGEEAWQHFSNSSSWMFEMTEQYNRRVAFNAAWELGMAEPNNRYVRETVEANPLQYQRLRNQGWTHQEAAAFTAAKDAVEKTQFVYAPYARPKIMWGRKGALFIFKSFVQNTLFNLWSNKSMAARSLLIMGALGGLMGLPGMEDINGILKALAFRLFGKDFDLEDEARKFAVDVTNGAIGPDMLLHGMSVKGFGIPHVMNGIGATVGLPSKFYPTLDRSKSIGMGNILPVEVGKLFGPSKDVKGAELQQLQRAAGAGFGNIFALYNFLTSEQSLSDMKRWELVMPRFAANVSHAFRLGIEGGERNRAGNKVVKFDVHDTEQMAEILARAMGYQPRRLSAEWEKIGALAEQNAFWDIKRGILLRQFGEAVKGNNSEDRDRVATAIRQYNSELPQEARGKSISVQALKDSVRNRLRVKALQESGQQTTKSGRVMEETLRKYFPDAKSTEGVVDARPVQ